MQAINKQTHEVIMSFAQLDVINLSQDAKIAALISTAKYLNVTPNHFLQIIKILLKQTRQISHIEYDYKLAMYETAYTVALFKARRCYHTMLASRKAA